MIIANKRLFNDRLSSIFIIAIFMFGRIALAADPIDGTIQQATSKTSGLSDKQLDQIKVFLKTMSRLIGFALIFMSIHSLKKFGQQSAMMQNSGASILGPFIKLFIGVLLIRPDQFIDVFYMSIWNYNQGEALNKAYSDPYGIIKNLSSVLNVIKVIGLISFIRGWLLVVRVAGEGQSQPGTLSKGFIHIFGGVLALNIEGTISLVENSFSSTT